MTVRTFAPALAAIAALAVACSSSSSGSGSTPQPVQACNHILDETCNAFVRCGKVPTKADCVSAAGKTLDCTKAASVDAGKEQQCVTALQAADCATLPPLPTACNGIVLVNKSIAPTTQPPATALHESSASFVSAVQRLVAE